MKLNPDCIRDILFYVEKNTDLKHHVLITAELAEKEFPSYSPDEVFYHVRQCELSGFFQNASRDLDGDFHIPYLSPYGHQFISDIRSDSVWSHVKSLSQKIGSNSLSALIQISSGVITQLIKSQLGIT